VAGGLDWNLARVDWGMSWCNVRMYEKMVMFERSFIECNSS
jgi:hypothetical protein